MNDEAGAAMEIMQVLENHNATVGDAIDLSKMMKQCKFALWNQQ